MCAMIFTSISHPFVIIGMLTDVRVEDLVKTLVEVFTANVRDRVIETLAAVSVGAIAGFVDFDIDVDIDVEVLAGANTNVLPAVTIASLAISAP